MGGNTLSSNSIPNMGYWGNPIAQTQSTFGSQPSWNMRPMAQVQNEPGMMPQMQQQPDISDFMRRFHGGGGSSALGFTRMQ